MYLSIQKILLASFIFIISAQIADAQINANILTKINEGSTTIMNNITGVTAGSLFYNTTDQSLNVHNGTIWNRLNQGSNWNLTGNTGVTTSEFLGSINDVPMVLRSNNTTMLQLGRRQTLGLYDANPTGIFPYNQPNNSVVWVRGLGGESALQFEATAASFYKPLLFTDLDGNFLMRGSSAATDFFEIGSQGASNDGRLVLSIGDDGDEPIIFRKYNYTTQSYIEMMRMQGTGLNSNVRVGINVNGAVPSSELEVKGTVTADDLYVGGTATTIGASTVNDLTVNGNLVATGAYSTGITTYAGTTNFTLNATHSTVIFTSITSFTVFLPTASTCPGRIYTCVKRNTGGLVFSPGYRNLSGTTITAFATNTAIRLQSDGTLWFLIN